MAVGRVLEVEEGSSVEAELDQASSWVDHTTLLCFVADSVWAACTDLLWPRKVEDLWLLDCGRDLHLVYVVCWCSARLVDCMVDFLVVVEKRTLILEVAGNSGSAVVDVVELEVAVRGQKMREDNHL